MILPGDFVSLVADRLGSETSDFCRALEASPQVSVRLNSGKLSRYSLSESEVLSGLDVESPVAWNEHGRYLSSRPLFTLDPFFHASAYYVQEASSMFLARVVKQYIKSPVRAIDLCAAPGGKSTVLLQTLPEKSFIVSNEYIRQRANILCENVSKWGNPNSMVTSNDVSAFAALGQQFDLMVVDAPCSGEGMFRKDETALADWSLQAVAACAERQKQILSSSYATLKAGGILVYSTCTFNRHEDEEITDFIASELDAERLDVDLAPQWGITRTNGGMHFYPHKTKGEGFFIAAFRKKGEPYENSVVVRKDKKKNNVSASVRLSDYLRDPDDFRLLELRDAYYAVPQVHADFVRKLMMYVNTLQVGVRLGQFKGRDFLPATELALSTAIDTAKFSVADVSRDQALAFLHRDNLQLPVDVARGYVLVTYRHLPLGFVKNLGNRSNSLYPEHWKIRMNINR